MRQVTQDQLKLQQLMKSNQVWCKSLRTNYQSRWQLWLYAHSKVVNSNARGLGTSIALNAIDWPHTTAMPIWATEPWQKSLMLCVWSLRTYCTWLLSTRKPTTNSRKSRNGCSKGGQDIPGIALVTEVNTKSAVIIGQIKATVICLSCNTTLPSGPQQLQIRQQPELYKN